MQNSSCKFLILVICVFFYSCFRKKTCSQKDQICGSAVVVLGNRTSDTIFFSVGGNQYDDILLPGQDKSLVGDKVNVTYDPRNDCQKKRTSWSTWTINSSQGIWAINVDNCFKKSVFRYDDEIYKTISLYDETDE